MVYIAGGDLGVMAGMTGNVSTVVAVGGDRDWSTRGTLCMVSMPMAAASGCVHLIDMGWIGVEECIYWQL